jgi:UrcA family protein
MAAGVSGKKILGHPVAIAVLCASEENMSAPLTFRHRPYSLKLAAGTIAMLFTAALFGAVDSPSHAADLMTRTTVVHYDDLDLHTAAGSATLERRVAGAVERVCKQNSERSLQDMALEAACRQSAIAQAQPRLQTALAAAGQHPQFAAAGSVGL